ncbi:MAG: response regulator [Novosphingobium sp.]|nr:response regulator [Novosphingobium sp.]
MNAHSSHNSIARRLLLVEDNPGDAELIADMLDVPGTEIELTRVERMAEAATALAQASYDVVLLDLRLPDCEGVDCVHNVRVQSADLAIIVLTGMDNEMLALECIAAGAQTYIGKDEIDSSQLRRAIAYSVVRAREAAAQRRAEALLVQLRHAQKLDTLGALSAGIAHDLNNTLQPIFTIVPWLEAQAQSDQARDALDMIRAAALRAKELVKEIVDFSRKEANSFELIRFDELMNAVLPMLSAGISPKIGLNVRMAPVPPILARRSQIFQIILNLVTNSAKAIGDGEGQIIVEVRDRAEENEVILAVEDDGAGMDEATLERIFEPFFTTRANAGGTGLGLAVVKNIVDEAGGRIGVTSTRGVGTRFEIVFPAEQGVEENAL